MFPNDVDKAADQWARLGATAKMRVSKTEMRYGTLQPKLPILVSNDGRLLPQTFEGGQVTSNEIDNLTFTAGQLEHATGRASSDRAGLAVAGGSQESNKFTRSEEHTSELQSLMRNSYAVFCLKKKT